MSDTPRTDAAKVNAINGGMDGWGFARTLERELAAARQECEEQARVNGMGASREAALLAKLEEAKREISDLTTRAEAAERIADTFVCGLLRNESSDGPWREIGMDHEGLLPQLVYAEGRHLIQRHPDRADTFRFTARGVETL